MLLILADMPGKKTWFALYTRPRFEQKATDSLIQMGFEAYLPTYKTLRQWSDRKKMVELPLFPSYCFVRIVPELYREPLRAHGVVRFVWIEGKPAPVPDKEIEAIKTLCSSSFPLEVTIPDPVPGQKVIITSGALKGIEGEFVDKAGSRKFLVRIHTINHAVLVNVDAGMVAAG